MTNDPGLLKFVGVVLIVTGLLATVAGPFVIYFGFSVFYEGVDYAARKAGQ